jgi:hypothetical protein
MWNIPRRTERLMIQIFLAAILRELTESNSLLQIILIANKFLAMTQVYF